VSREPLPLRSSASLPGVPFGDPPLAPKAMKGGRLAENSNASEPMFAYEDREVLEKKRAVVIPRPRWAVKGNDTNGHSSQGAN